jgi:phage shock protein PspC (stress-responsive transcriptional regulator)
MLKNANNEGMLAGVCSRLATCLGWNVWAVRAVLLILLVTQPIATAIGYGIAALVITGLDRHGKTSGANPGPAEVLQSPELSNRKQRIEALEERFAAWEKTLEKE